MTHEPIMGRISFAPAAPMSELRRLTVMDPVAAANEIRKLQDEVASLQAERDAALEALFRCYELSGSDTNGDNWEVAVRSWKPGLPVLAVKAVEDIRKDYDECPTPEDLADAERQRDELERLVEAYRAEYLASCKEFLGSSEAEALDSLVDFEAEAPARLTGERP